MDLFDLGSQYNKLATAPLAYRMRPQSLNELVGQQHIVGPGTLLRKAIEKDEIHSLILFGPPGTGKTSIARIIARTTSAHFDILQAVSSGVSEMRKIIQDAEQRIKYYQQKTILFVDEIHRFNKNQQDVLLPAVEEGLIILIGATTENPLYELNNALLSRIKLYLLEPLDDHQVKSIIRTAIDDRERGLGKYQIDIDDDSMDFLVMNSKGDARMVLNILETVVNSFADSNNRVTVSLELLHKVLSRPVIKYDKTGDYHYDTISAFIKSIRGSDPDAALFWLAVMLEGGEDPEYIARRLIVHAAEDVGLADPLALTIAGAAADAVRFVGLPEARIPLAEATIYLATAPKSNSSKMAIDLAIEKVRQCKNIAVPAHIADTSHSRSALLGKGKNYKYPHNYGGYVEQKYLPDEIEGSTFYHPGDNGYEITIQLFLNRLPQKN